MATGTLAPESKSSRVMVHAGTIALDGSNPTPVQTPFTTILGASVSLNVSTAPGDNTAVVTWAAVGGVLNIYAWKNTSGTDPTLVASTGTESVGFVVVGV